MNTTVTNQPTPEILKKAKAIPNFGTFSILIGILLLLLGAMGIVLPEIMSLEVSILIASLFVVGGIFWGSHSFKYSRHQWSEWLKPFLLLVSGGLMLFYPMSGVAAIGLLLAIYLLLDSFASFTLAYGLYNERGWGWMAFNGITSLFLAVLFLAGWPASSLLLVGLYVAISLFFDGSVLIYLGWIQKKLASN